VILSCIGTDICFHCYTGRGCWRSRCKGTALLGGDRLDTSTWRPRMWTCRTTWMPSRPFW